MNSARRPLLAVFPAAVVLAAGLLAGAGAGPAAAGTGPGQFPPGNQTGSGTSSGGTYASNVAAQVSVTGDKTNGFSDVDWTPPECWLQPMYKWAQTYAPGDPGNLDNIPTDATDFYFWFGLHFEWFDGVLAHVEGSRQEILQDFQQVQKGQAPAGWPGPTISANDIWWAPNWINGTSGLACATNLYQSSNLDEGFIGLETPVNPGAGGNGEISNKQLAELARAALRLPTLKIVTSPRTKATVNVPTDVMIEYLGDGGTHNPQDTATVSYEGIPWLSATVSAKLSSVQISSNAPSSTANVPDVPGEACATARACSITFHAPSGLTPWTITATVTWKVTWTTSADDAGVFPLAHADGTVNITVREIQSET